MSVVFVEAQVFHQVRVIVKETFLMNVVFVAEAESRMVIVIVLVTS